jgi:hypothetical protein
VKGQVGLDLSDAGKWWRFCDVHFDRCLSSESALKSLEPAAKVGDHTDYSAKLFREVTVVFVVDVSPLMPSRRALKQEVREKGVGDGRGHVWDGWLWCIFVTWSMSYLYPAVVCIF